MSILAWNYRGLGNSETMKYLFSLVKHYNLFCIILSETKGKLLNFQGVIKKLGFDDFEIVEAKGQSGGLLVM